MPNTTAYFSTKGMETQLGACFHDLDLCGSVIFFTVLRSFTLHLVLWFQAVLRIVLHLAYLQP